VRSSTAGAGAAAAPPLLVRSLGTSACGSQRQRWIGGRPRPWLGTCSPHPSRTSSSSGGSSVGGSGSVRGLVVGAAESSSNSGADSAGVRALLQRSSPAQALMMQRYLADREAFILGGRGGGGGGSRGSPSRLLPLLAAPPAASPLRLPAPVPALLADDNAPSVPIVFVDLPSSGEDNAAAAERAADSPGSTSSAGWRYSPPLPTQVVPSLEQAVQGHRPSSK
jgi:hypothetical protein